MPSRCSRRKFCWFGRHALRWVVSVPRLLNVKFGPAVAGLLSVGAIAVVVAMAVRRHANPTRCGAGWVSLGPRCCAEGQSLHDGHCVARATRCPTGFHRALADAEGCAYDFHRIRIATTKLSIGPNDWQSENVTPIDTEVLPFEVDATEVTHEQWLACVASQKCPATVSGEPGQPVVGVTIDQAQSFCAFKAGRLPLLNERLAMAAGGASRRFPWGQTGLVCRRAHFGAVVGPCAEGGTQPEIAGSHPDGRSPEGVLDLSGNVAELTLDTAGKAWACGGSFRSQTALELKSWACGPASSPADDVGFRCVYDVHP